MQMICKELKRALVPVIDLPTAVFIDYESLYYSFKNQFSVQPDLDQILTEIKQNGNIKKIKVFGDFTTTLSAERNRVRTITSDIIDCSKNDGPNKKDFTDFIMLDHVYQEAIQNEFVTQYIFFTGDGHFSSAATFLRTFKNIVVGIYGVKGTLSNQLKDCSSWAKWIEVTGIDQERHLMDIIKNFENSQRKGLSLTFMSTVNYLTSYYGGDSVKYQDVLSQLLEDGHVEYIMVNGHDGKSAFRGITPNMEKLEKLKQEVALTGKI